jgi:hypothetical protein
MHDLDGPAAARAALEDIADLPALTGRGLVVAEAGENAVDLGHHASGFAWTAGRHSAVALLAVVLRSLAHIALLQVLAVFRPGPGNP